MEHTLKLPIKFMDSILNDIKNVLEFAEEHKLTNEQEFLNFLDEINKLSVKY